MLSRYNYRFYPTPHQQLRLAHTFGCCRFVYNHILAIIKSNTLKFTSAYDLIKLVTLLKSEHTFLKDVSSVALQQSVSNLGSSFKNFFDSLKGKRKGQKIGFPKFKKRTNSQSCTFQSNGYQLLANGEISIAKIGTIKPIYSRELPSTPTSCTITKDCADRYFISFVVQVEPVQIYSESPSIGIDLGIQTFAICSDGTAYKSPNTYNKLYDKIAKAQHKHAKSQPGSKRRNNLRLSIAKLHNKITDIRKDFHHKVSTLICSKNQTVSLEHLNVKGMLANRKLSKAISRQGWSNFVVLIKAKCDKFGREFVQIGRFYPSSQICNECGYRWGSLDLSIRTIKCERCGVIHDRDINAAKNIDKVGIGHGHDYKCAVRAGKTR
jgi:putative transposase